MGTMRRAGAVATAALAFLAGTDAALTVHGLHDEPARADAAVVLGNRVEPDGRPSQQLEGRLQRALEVWRAGLVRRVVVSGGKGVEGFEEAEVMADWLVARGVPRPAVVVDRTGVNTFETARAVRRLVDAGELRSVVVITSWYHVPRSELALRRHGVVVAGSLRARHGPSRRDPWSLAREAVGFWWYVVRPV